MIAQIENLPEVSFIDDLTLDNIQEEMVSDYCAKYKEITGKTLVLGRADPEVLKLYAASVQIFHLLLHIDKAGKMDLLKYAYGDFLDNLGALRGVTRLPASPAVTTVRFFLSDVQGSAVTIPEGTRVSNGGEIYFATDETVEIAAGDLQVDVGCTCTMEGDAGNSILAGAINTIVDPIAYVESVTNTESTNGGSDIESDEDLAERIYLAPASYSVAGPKDAYISQTQGFSSMIGDVEVTSPDPCEVEVRFLLKDGSLPGEALLSDVEEYLRDGNIRPLTDNVTVISPGEISFDIDLTYSIRRSDTDRAKTIQSQVEAAVEKYIIWQTYHIGRDISPSVLVQYVMEAGAKWVKVASPDICIVPSGHVPRVAGKTITYGGIEDD